ncbi:MAG: DNA polymerase domain-containing protein [Thermoplasmata archaeon]
MSVEADAWLLDITEHPDGRSVDLWTKDRPTGRVSRRSEPFRPPFYVLGSRSDLADLERQLSSHPDTDSVAPSFQRPSLFEERRRHMLSVVPARNPLRRRLARTIDAIGEFHRFTLYDVDLTPPQLYHLTHDLYPFAPVRTGSGSLAATEPPEVLEYDAPPMRIAPLEIRFDGAARRQRIPSAEAHIRSVRIGETILEGPEPDLLRALAVEVARIDPDVIRTDGGDSLDLPWIYRRAEAAGLVASEIALGRIPVPFRPERAGRSYMTYGRVVHQAASFNLPGRFHIDRENSFLFEDTDLDGLIDAARLSRLSLQTILRQSPGTCFTAMEIAQALELGVRVPWKKNRPERFRSGAHLVLADRGGAILQPPVGVHDRVEEFDFVSLFPQIMITKNLSAETLDCRCCPESPRIAPGLGYRSCTRRVGLIPRTLHPLVTRRLAYKAAMRRRGIPANERARLARRVKMLKWILVTAFGYQGYRNARFGRIECHEAINAYAREVLANLSRAGEELGYRTLHGIVDSLWVQPRKGEAEPDPEAFAERMSERFGLPLGYEGRYRWIVFLPATTHGFGVPNRYYGRYVSGEFKLRGIGGRRHDTTVLVRRFEAEALQMLEEARDAPEVRARVPRALARADRFAARLREGAWPLEELLITHHIGTALEVYRSFRDETSALRQLASLGLARAPGESVRYVILDRSSRSWRDRARVAETMTGEERYDVGAYLEILARGVETLLAPFGIDRIALRARWGIPAERERSPYASGSHPEQRLLASEGGAPTF